MQANVMGNIVTRLVVAAEMRAATEMVGASLEDVRSLRETSARLCPLLTDRSILQQWHFGLPRVRTTP